MTHNAEHSLMLGVNIDHVATLRQARGSRYPDPIHAAAIAEQSGADLITVHLREDRRHIQDRDLRLLRETLQTRMNLECAVTAEMLAIACNTAPEDVCLVPEKREEVTTEGGLDVRTHHESVRDAVSQLSDAGIRVSLFIDPDKDQIDHAVASGAPVVELHTGAYAEARGSAQQRELARLIEAAKHARASGLVVNAGHGLTRHNLAPVAKIVEVVELNIGHALISDAVFMGLPAAVAEYRQRMLDARQSLGGDL